MPSAAGGATHKGGIKAYWKRRGYGRLDAAAAQRRPRLPTAELGVGEARPEPEPGRRRRGVYVNAMYRLASSAAVAGYGAAGPYCTTADPFARPRPLTRDYDEKALVEIYRAILARGEAVPAVAAARLPAAV
ncbi:hypothetical protein PVAP13_3NG147400 [Panicum virgatum]|uniref:Uncharacterized protein n=1 Tax=Panicum virgatum TaxID=38727 RepID=A0A8T0UH58_PANVG|nr:hypothetical protein PVAP13_3NG147400 [Panicum virgatum]